MKENKHKDPFFLCLLIEKVTPKQKHAWTQRKRNTKNHKIRTIKENDKKMNLKCKYKKRGKIKMGRS